MGFISVFRAPDNNYTDYDDQDRFRSTWYMYLFCTFVFTLLGIIHIIYKDTNIIPTSIALLLCISMVVYMRINKEFRIVAIITTIVASIIIQVNIFTLVNMERYIDALWIMVLTSHSFYTLGRKWGIGTLIVNCIGLVIYTFVIPKSLIIESLENALLASEIDEIVNVILSCVIIAVIQIRIWKNTRHAHQKYEKALKESHAQNEQISTQNKEKTTLIQEIHHRVKNNLQIISSLLRLQADDCESDETKKELHEAVNRISSIALIHEKMYQNDSLSKLSIESYIEDLCNAIIQAHAINRVVTLNVNSDLYTIEIRSLVPLALILNELVTNSLKHSDSNKSLAINLKLIIVDKKVKLVYEDNSKWLQNEKSGFGTMLIETFTEQLEGEFSREEVGTARYIFTFPLNNNPLPKS